MHFDPNVDPELLSSMETAASSFSPYKVELTSGRRARNPRHPKSFHPLGEALDVQLYDPKSGAALDNYQGGGAITPYQQFANHWYKSLSPELQKRARWGGYFGDPTQPGYGQRYGEQDYMHFDLGRSPTAGMLAGDWSTGYKPEAMQALGLKDAGGVEAMVQQVAQATGMHPDVVKRAFLSSIAGTEAPAYNTLYGGGTFGEDYSQHPNRRIPIMSGPNKGDYSTAAGRYQFLNSTWADEQKRLGLKDFSPESQDAAAWDLAQRTYKDATGGDLMEALNSGDPGRINAAAKILSSQWTSLPGGIEQAGGYGTKTFADVFNSNLGATDSAGTTTASARGEQFGPPMSAAPDKKDWKDTIGDALGEGVAGLGGNAQLSLPQYPMQQPAAAVVQAQPQQPVDPAAQGEQRRQQLAMLMQRLNQGSLF